MNETELGTASAAQVLQPALKSECGAIAVTVAIVMVVLLSFAALALDISNAMIARNELQNVADAAALAGARSLGQTYAGLPSGTSYASYWASNSAALTTTAKTAATNVAIRNQARQVTIEINAADITINFWDTTTRQLRDPILASGEGGTGVRVTARRDSLANGPVATWLAGIMGINSMNVVATATAALTGTGTLLPPDVPPPFGISQLFFTPGYCGRMINFSPTTTSCAGWHTFDNEPSSAETVKRILDVLLGQPTKKDPPSIPVVSVGDNLNYIGGELGNAAWPSLVDLYMAKRVPDGSSPSGYCWHVSIPVYKEEGGACSNVNNSVPRPTVGFASACVENVINDPSGAGRVIMAHVTCGEVANGQGGGGNFGTLGSIPGLVE